MRRTVSAALVLLAAGCGGSSSPTTPTPPPTPQNHAPVITSATIAPTFAVAYLTPLAYSAQASDPDGDALSYRWEFADGTSQDGQTFSKTYSAAGETNARIVVTDSHGASVNTYTNVAIVGSMTGTWHGNGPTIGTFQLRLTQDRSFVTGSFSHAAGNGTTDPAQPGTIDARGRVSLRIKIRGNFQDFTLTGQMDHTGRRVAGTLKGSGFSGDAFEMVK